MKKTVRVRITPEIIKALECGARQRGHGLTDLAAREVDIDAQAYLRVLYDAKKRGVTPQEVIARLLLEHWVLAEGRPS